jgi:hypothetical protein
MLQRVGSCGAEGAVVGVEEVEGYRDEQRWWIGPKWKVTGPSQRMYESRLITANFGATHQYQRTY